MKISRELYRAVKNMNATEMATFLENVYQEGFDAALERNTTSISLESLHNAIASVKGIGDKRMAEIDEAIKTVFEKKEKSNG
jgi:hypothetical protein